VAQGVPFAREYGGLLSNRSFGGTQVQRTFYAAGQTGQQLLIGAYQALERQVALGNVKTYSRHEMLDIVNIDGKCRGIIVRNLITGNWNDTLHMPCCCALADMGTCSISPPTPWAVM
jgi:succinate dehydrogenase / fumarate reductase flavoprotein subunit